MDFSPVSSLPTFLKPKVLRPHQLIKRKGRCTKNRTAQYGVAAADLANDLIILIDSLSTVSMVNKNTRKLS